MKTVISAVSVLACAFSLDAQITARLNRLSDSADEVRIRNNSATSLVAFAVTVKQAPMSGNSSKAPLVVFSDLLIDPAAKPLPAGEERVVMSSHFILSSGRHLPLEEPIVTAGILADGAPAGDPALLARLLSRRSNMLLAIETTLETLSDAGNRNVPRGQLIDQFRKLAASVRRWYLPSEQQVGLALYQSIVGKLMSLPAGQLGSPFPPADFVVEETAALRQQRVALSESQPSLLDAALVERRIGQSIGLSRP
jgi:hypothetical protein